MPDYKSDQAQAAFDHKLFNHPDGGGDMRMLRFRAKAPVVGDIGDVITFGTIKPGYRFNPNDAKMTNGTGTATSTLSLGHTGYSNVDDDGVISNIALDVDEFLVAEDIATAVLIGVPLLNARDGGVHVSPKNAAGKTVDGITLTGTINTAAQPAGQEIFLEIPAFKA